jgi:site-specific DNA-cytosine methylase
VTDITWTCADFFCGAGGMVGGYEAARAEMAGVRGRFKTVLAVDVWPVAAQSCERMNGVRVEVADLFTADQYVQFHAARPCWCGSRAALGACHASPPPAWVEFQPADLRRLCPEGVRVLKGSPPCNGFSRLLGADAAAAEKYQALNGLVVRWLWLWLEAFPECPPELILMENVPDIADPKRKKRRRGEALVERVEQMLSAYGYASRRTAFDCGPISGLAQHRDRFLMVARRVATTQAPLLEPFEMQMQTIGDVIRDLPPPVADFGIPMHVLPGNARKTSERLAFVTGGADWRSIEGNWLSSPGWAFVNDVLLPTDAAGGIDARLGRIAHNNVLRLGDWDAQSPCVTGGGGGANGNVADPRPAEAYYGGIYGVRGMDDQACTVTGRSGVTTGAFSVEDTRLSPADGRHSCIYAVEAMDKPSRTVTGGGGGGRPGLADPRLTCTPNGATLRVIETDGQSPPVIGTAGVWSSGSMQVADARVNAPPRNGSFGVQELDDQADTVTGSIDVHNGPAAVAAPPAGRVLIAPDWKLWHRTGRWVPRAWHRPFSLKELARLQSFPDRGHDGRPIQLAGTLDEQRMQIGNAVPMAAARVIAELMLATLLASRLGVPVSGGSGIWVREAGVLRWYASSRGQRSMVGDGVEVRP